mgnify:CR=1 FL=1
MSWIDLHMHSAFSNDGDFTPEELVGKCQAAGIRLMAVADHNSCKAVQGEMAEAKKRGISCISAIELDCCYENVDLHVLGYGIDVTDSRFAELEENLADEERASSAPRLQMMRERGLVIDEKKAYDLAHYGYVTGEVIAEVALADPRNDGHPMLKEYRPGGSRSDNPYVNFYWDWCAKGKEIYIPIHFISLREAISLIQSSGGTPVLAHPGNNVKEKDELLDEILKCGIEGIEVYSTYHSPEQIKYYRKKADDYHLAITCGSDFHGKTKPSIRLGTMDCGGEEDRIAEGLRGLGIKF